MANLVQLSNDLESVPKKQLIQMSQDPNSTYPSYLVLAEIQRRTQMEKMYAAQQPKPQTTVAEEVVSKFASSPSGLGAMAQPSDLSNAFPSGEMGNMAPPSPLMTAASGGLTGYQAGGSIGAGTDSLSATFTNPMEKQVTQEQKSFFKERYTKPDGSIDFGRAALDGFNAATLAMILAPEPTTTVVGGALKGVAGVGKGLYNLVRNPKQTIDKGLSSLGRLKSRFTEGKRFNNPISTPQSTSNLPVPASKFKDMGLEVVKDVAPRAAGAAILIPQLIPDKEINPVTVQTQDENSKDTVSKDVITGNTNADAGLGQRFKDFANSSRNADMLIGLGGAIGSARNLGELSSGISDAYFGVKSAEQASEFKGLQGRLIEAQTAKYEADLANMPLDAILTSLSTAQKQLESFQDSGDLDSASELILYINALNKRAAELQGITITEKDKRDELLGLVQEVG